MLTDHIPLPDCEANQIWARLTANGWAQLVIERETRSGTKITVIDCVHADVAARMMIELRKRVAVHRALTSAP